MQPRMQNSSWLAAALALLAITDQSLPVYPDTMAGESTKLALDFPDPPPQISHTIEDMYPITMDDNECFDCHHL
jgi:nitrate reductase cytochrome c-type subunit